MKHCFSILVTLFLFSYNANAQLAVGDTAINFTLPDTNGTAISLSDFSGDVILLNFFASWCVPCSIEAPQLQDSIWNVYRNQGFTLIGVDFQEPLFPLLSFINFYNLTFPIVRDTAGDVFNDYGLIVLPSNVLINQNGIVVWTEPGFDIPVMKGLIDSLLNITKIPKGNSNTFPANIELITNYPNPFNNQTNIKIRLNRAELVNVRIYDINGRIVSNMKQKMKSGENDIRINMSDYANGIYFYSLAADKDFVKGKFILYK